jgi:putative oxidoreductase
LRGIPPRAAADEHLIGLGVKRVKIAVLIPRILLGLMFCLFGSNWFFSFLPAQMPPGVAGQFLSSVMTSHYVYLVAATQLVAGILLIINRYVVLALALLAPVITNIVTYHLTMQPAMAQVAILATLLWIFLFWWYRAHFACLWAGRRMSNP